MAHCHATHQGQRTANQTTRNGKQRRTENGMGTGGKHRGQRVPHGKGRHGQDHIPARTAQAVAQAHGGARADRHRRHQRRGLHNPLFLPASALALRTRGIIRRQGAAPLPVRPRQAQHHPHARPARNRRDKHGEGRPARRRRLRHAALPPPRPAASAERNCCSSATCSSSPPW